MRLKDPLQGVKMAQGHIIIHFIFFVLAVLLPFLSSGYSSTDKKDLAAVAEQERAVHMLKWGHCATFIVIVASLVLKKYQMYNRAQILLVATLPFSYGYPLTKSIYVFMMTKPQLLTD